MYDATRQRYGGKKVWRELRREGRKVARCTVARVYKAMGLHGVVRGKRVQTTVPEPLAHRPQDLVQRNFTVGSRGDAYDNALAETINGLYKTEVIRHLGPWKGLDDVEFATLEWVSWYNSQRLMQPLDYLPSAEYEEQYQRAQADQSASVLN